MSDLVTRLRKTYRKLEGVVVVSPHLIAEAADALELPKRVYVLQSPNFGNILSVHSSFELAEAARDAKVKADGGYFAIKSYGMDPA